MQNSNKWKGARGRRNIEEGKNTEQAKENQHNHDCNKKKPINCVLVLWNIST